MPTLKQALARGKTLIGDGAWGSTLINEGLEPGRPPEAWNLERPGVIAALARAYAAAGADVLTTNTFGANRTRLEAAGLAGELVAINRAGVELVREALPAHAVLCAVLGPTGRCATSPEPEPDALLDVFLEQARVLVEAGARTLLIETMYEPEEARAAVTAARHAGADEVCCTFTFERAASGGFRTLAGHEPASMVQAARDAGADFLGVNCTLAPADMVPLVAALRTIAPGIPLIVQPNAGQPCATQARLKYPISPAGFAEQAPALIGAGAAILGGCCGTTPAHIQALRASVARHEAATPPAPWTLR